jgi:hypothetical protein
VIPVMSVKFYFRFLSLFILLYIVQEVQCEIFYYKALWILCRARGSRILPWFT